MWGLGAAFFFVEYFARVSPSVMIPELMAQYQVTAMGVGSLSAFFYYAYVGMQLPVGLMVDRYGPHRLLAVMAASCALGCWLFAMAGDFYAGQVARFIMGFGAAFAFVGTLKIAMMWLPRKRFGFIAGLTQAIGMLGAAAGEGPLKQSVSHFGWQPTMVNIAIALGVLSVLIALLVRDRKDDLVKSSLQDALASLLSALKVVMRNKTCWRNAFFIGLLYAPTGTFGELWGVSYLHRTHQISEQYAAFSISMLFVGIGLVGPITGWLSDYLGARVLVMRVSALMSLFSLLVLLYLPLQSGLIPVMCFLFGACNTGLAVSYAYASEITPHHVGGTSLAFANMASVIIAGFLQPLLGGLLDLFWSGQSYLGARVYGVQSYHQAVIVLPVCLLLAFIMTFSLKELSSKNNSSN